MASMRQPVAGVDYDADAPMGQDDYEYLTSTGQYAGNGWAEEQERKAAKPAPQEDWEADWRRYENMGGALMDCYRGW